LSGQILGPDVSAVSLHFFAFALRLFRWPLCQRTRRLSATQLHSNTFRREYKHKNSHLFIATRLFRPNFMPPDGLFSRRGRRERRAEIETMRCNLLPDSNFHLCQKGHFVLSLRSLRLCASLSFLPLGQGTKKKQRKMVPGHGWSFILSA
jgi:hypothetical protein